MSFLTIAGITVPVQENGAEETIERESTDRRAFAGNLLTSTRWELSQWNVTTAFLTHAEAAAITRACAFGAEVTCSGTLIDPDGGECTCVVRVTNGAYINTATDDGTGVLRSLVLRLRDVNPSPLFAYAPGTSLSDATFTRSTTATYASES